MRTAGTMPENARKCHETAPIESKPTVFLPELLTIKQFCRSIPISERQYYRLQAEGDGPRRTRLGGVVLIAPRERERWILEHTER